MTPEDLDRVLRDFREWLATAPPVASEPDRPSVDLATLVGQFVALRHEVNLQTRATRAQQDQTAKVLEELQAAASSQSDEHRDTELRPIFKAMIDVADAQALALRELERLLASWSKESDVEPPRLSWLARKCGIGLLLERLQPESPSQAARARIEASISGLRLGLQRIERALTSVGLAPVSAIGQQFNPETMEAIEAVESPDGHGIVLGEVRRGYLRNGRVFRFAQVRVAK